MTNLQILSGGILFSLLLFLANERSKTLTILLHMVLNMVTICIKFDNKSDLFGGSFSIDVSYITI